MEEKVNGMPIINQYIHMAEAIVANIVSKVTFLQKIVLKLPQGNLCYLTELPQGLVELQTYLYLLDDCKISLKYLRTWGGETSIFTLLHTNTDSSVMQRSLSLCIICTLVMSIPDHWQALEFCLATPDSEHETCGCLVITHHSFSLSSSIQHVLRQFCTLLAASSKFFALSSPLLP